MGLERLHLLTTSGSYRVRFEWQELTGYWFSVEYGTGSSTSMTRPEATSCMSADTSPETMAELCAYEIPINRPYLTLIVNIHTHAQSAAKIQYYWLFVI